VHPILLVCRNPAAPERPAGHAKSQNQTRSDRCVTSRPILATVPPAILSFYVTAGNPDVGRNRHNPLLFADRRPFVCANQRLVAADMIPRWLLTR
jgi:hypothetical protein